MAGSLQVLFLLDLASEYPLDLEEVNAHLPDHGKNVVLFRISHYGVKAAARGAPQDWDEAATALNSMMDAAHEVTKEQDGQVEYFVAGRAALPIFAHLGIELSKWPKVTLLNKRPEGAWDVVRIGGDITPIRGTKYFTEVRGFLEPPSTSIGRVGIFVSSGFHAQPDVLRDYMEAEGDAVAGLVELRTDAMLESDNGAAAAQELVDALKRVKASYPGLSGIALFIAGPATLAFLAGRAVNTHVIDDILIPQYEAKGYQPGLWLTWKDRSISTRPRPALRVKPITVLYLGSSPTDKHHLELKDESNVIKRALKKYSRSHERFAEWGVQAIELQEHIYEYHPNIIHFGGHGAPTGELMFENTEGGPALIPLDVLEELFAILRGSVFKGKIRCVVLNACFSEAQARLIAAHVDCVVGMAHEIRDDAAIEFADAFYRALANGENVEAAVDRGRLQIKAARLPGAELVQLFSRLGVEPATVTFAIDLKRPPASTGG